MTNFLRIQSERASYQAVYISPTTLCCAFPVIHAERAVGDGTNPTHVFGGDTCTYGVSYVVGATNGLVSLVGTNCDYYGMRASDANVQFGSGVAGLYQGNRVRGLVCADLTELALNTYGWSFESVTSTGLFTAQAGAGQGAIRFTFSKLTNLLVENDSTYVQLVDTQTTGTYSTSTGAATVELIRGIHANFPNTATVLLDRPTITAAYTLGTNQLVKSWGATCNGAITGGAGSVFFGYAGTKFNANLVGSSGASYGVLDQSCRVSQGSTVGTDWYGTPGALPAVLPSWDQGTVRYNPLPASGGFIGSVCTTGSSSAAGTWKTFGVIS